MAHDYRELSKEQLLDLLQNSEDEKQRLQMQLAINDMAKKPIRWFFKYAIFGPKLSGAAKNLLDEYADSAIPTRKAISFLVWALLSQMIRLNVMFFLIGLIPTAALIFQTVFISRQNKLFTEQNKLIVEQMNFLKQEVALMSEQTAILSQSNEVASEQVKGNAKAEEINLQHRLSIELSSLLSDIDSDLKKEFNDDRNLSADLKTRIIEFTRKAKPYEYIYENISPERGKIFKALLQKKVNAESLGEIFKEGDFSYADLRKVQLDHEDIYFIDLNNADIRNAELSGCTFKNVILNKANLSGSKCWGSTFKNVEMEEAKLIGTGIQKVSFIASNLKNTDLQGVVVESETSFEDCEMDNCIVSELDSKNTKLLFERIEKTNTHIYKPKVSRNSNAENGQVLFHLVKE